jgi:hypothetical protein
MNRFLTTAALALSIGTATVPAFAQNDGLTHSTYEANGTTYTVSAPARSDEYNKAQDLIARVANATKNTASEFNCADPTDKTSCQTRRVVTTDEGLLSYFKFGDATVVACIEPTSTSSNYGVCGSDGGLFGIIRVNGILTPAPKDDPRCKGFGDNISQDYLACEAALPPKN